MKSGSLKNKTARIYPDRKELILVTGGAGYKGSTLCRELLFRGYKVRVLDCLMYGGRSLSGVFNHPNFELIKGDIVNPKDVSKALEGVSNVIHLAAIVGDKPCERDPEVAIKINYQGTQLLADMSRKKHVKHFIFASTCSNYGITDASLLADENSKLNPVSLYAETKIDCEKYLLGLKEKGDFCPLILRFGTAFGISGRTRFDLTVNSFTYEALRDRKIIAFAEESWRPFIHVLDMSEIYCAMLEIPKEIISGQIYNAGWNKQNFMKRDIINAIKEVIGDFEVDYINTIEDKRSYRVNFEKLEKLLQFEPKMSLKNGISEVAWAVTSGVLTGSDFENNKLK